MLVGWHMQWGGYRAEGVGRVSIPRVDIAEEGVAVGNQRRVEGRLSLGVMSERGRVGRHLFGKRGRRFAKTAGVGAHGNREQSCKGVCRSYIFWMVEP